MPATWRTLAPALLSILILAGSASAKPSQCIDWPRLMSQYRIANLPSGPSIAISSLSNYTGKPGDDWLSFGIRDLLADMLRSGRDLRVLFGPTLAGQTGAPDMTAGGSFQHADGRLRVFISVADGKSGKLIKQIEASFPYPGNRDLFTELAWAAEKILDLAKVKYDRSALSAVRDATADTRAYESYAKGRQALWNYTEAKAEVAEAFFVDTKRLDYRSPLGYVGMADLKTFLGFYHRQRREQFASFYQDAEREIADMKRLTKVSLPAWMFDSGQVAGKGAGLQNRFLSGNAAAAEAHQLEIAGNQTGALAAIKKAVEIVPEDALSWYHLSRIEAAAGNSSAATAALQKAYGINPCVER